MKTIKLNVAERLAALAIFNNPENKVNTSDLKVYLDDVDKFRIADGEKGAMKWEDVKDEDGNVVNIKWDDANVDPKKIEMDPFTEKNLKEKLEQLEYSAVDPLANAVLSLLEKLK